MPVMKNDNPTKLSQHALNRSFQRWITKKDIQRVVKDPIETKYNNDTNRFTCFGLGTDSY